MSWTSIPYIFVAFVIFCAVTSVMRHRASKQEEKNRDDLMVAENAANQTRAVNLATLDYLQVPLTLLPSGNSDPEIAACEEKVRELSTHRLLNLNSMTNTEIKAAYGAANLEMLSIYDNDFTELCMTLNTWGAKLHAAGQDNDAAAVLSCAVRLGSDIKSTYTVLGDIYFSQGAFDKIDDLILTAEGLDSLQKTPILNALRSY